jgi:ribosome-associated protein
MCETVIASMEDAKGLDIKSLDVRNLTDITDYMIVATGSSDRHVKTISDRVLEFMAKQGWKPLGVEGDNAREWILVDYVDVVVHIMREQTRKHYDLESLWNETFSELNEKVVVEVFENAADAPPVT